MRRGPPWAPMRRRRPPQCRWGPSGPESVEAPTPKRREPRRSQIGKSPRTIAGEAPVVTKRQRLPPQCGGGLGSPKEPEAPAEGTRGPRGPKAAEAPARKQQGPRQSQSGGGYQPNAAVPQWS